VSDLEVDWQEHEDTLYYIRYELAGGEGAVEIATVRPETMLADTAVAVNPNDERFRHLVGKTAILPLVGRELPIIADEYVDAEFGTGAIKVTPGHDPNDYEIGRRHNLEIISCIEKDGTIVNADWVPDELRSLDVMDARRRIVDLLRETDHLTRSESIVHEVAHCDRCGAIIEPLIDDQWWCAMGELSKPAITAVEEGRIRFFPERWTGPYLHWMRNLRDWNISRQIWLGHRVPVYYCDAGHGAEVSSGAPDEAVASMAAQSAFTGGRELHTETFAFASIEEPDACPMCGNRELRQDPDVLDTWFSSALWPFATMGWPDETEDLRTFYPTDMLATAREIIYLWVARMIMTSLKFVNEIPFRTILIHAVIQDPQGRRMSKSKGNGVDPLDMIEKYGADAVRAWSAEVALPRQDVRFDEVRIESYMRFANKLWQMHRLVLIAHEGVALVDPAASEDPFDRWILSRLDALIGEVTEAIEHYRPGDAIGAIYEFAWHEYADWYLEICKPRFRLEESDPARAAAASTALHVLDVVVRLAHPFIPFVSEAIWQALPGERRPLIARADSAVWPEPAARLDPKLDSAMEALFELVRQLRDARKELGFKDRERAGLGALRVAADSAAELIDSDAGREAISVLASVDFVGEATSAPARTLVAGGLELSLFSPDRKPGSNGHASVQRELEQARAEVEHLSARLANPDFTSKAKPEVVEEARARLAQAEERLATLRRVVGDA
jgi:valyl-tRNA synthetase